MLEADANKKNSEVVSLAAAVHSGGSITFAHPFNGSASKLFQDGSLFHEGLAAVEIQPGKWCHITLEMAPAYKARFDWVGDFHYGLAPASMGDTMFHINRRGKRVYQKNFAHVGIFHEGLAVAKGINGQMFHILPNGKHAYQYRFHNVSEYSEGLAVAQSAPEDAFHFIDHFGLPQGMGRYEEAFPFCEGLAAVSVTHSRGFHIDHAGKQAYKASFHRVGSFSEGAAPASKKVKVDGASRVESFHIDSHGHRLYQDAYDFVHPFYHGIAMVRRFNRKTGYIDIHGRPVRK